MILRREFLQLGLSAGLGALLPFPLLAETMPDGAGNRLPSFQLPLFRLLHDTRQAASLARVHALGMQLPGARLELHTLLQPVHGDISRFWSDELQPRWQQQRMAVAGCTSQDVLFCLEQLARDHQLRVLWREEHAAEAGPALVSWLIAA